MFTRAKNEQLDQCCQQLVAMLCCTLFNNVVLHPVNNCCQQPLHSYTVEKFARVKIARYLDICHKTRRETRLYVCRSTDAMTGHVLENTIYFRITYLSHAASAGDLPLKCRTFHYGRSTDAMTGHVLENTVIFKTVNHISAEHIS